MRPFPWVILVAWAVLWFAPRINEWIDRSSRPKPPRIIRRGTSRELERRDR
jgi:hypothetical protein